MFTTLSLVTPSRLNRSGSHLCLDVRVSFSLDISFTRERIVNYLHNRVIHSYGLIIISESILFPSVSKESTLLSSSQAGHYFQVFYCHCTFSN